jgi:RNA polymerase sigma-70 factor (ECF subfamily)
MITGLAKYRPSKTPFLAWLYRIARNLTIDHYRKSSRRDLVPLFYAEEAVEQGESLHAQIETRFTFFQVQRALQKLEPLQCEVVTLRFLNGLSLREVAQTLGKTVSAIKSLQHRGIGALRAALQDGGQADG